MAPSFAKASPRSRSAKSPKPTDNNKSKPFRFFFVDEPELNKERRCKNPWSQFTANLHAGITKLVVKTSLHAAKYPKSYVSIITLLSFALIASGFFTNFNIQVDYETIYAPYNNLPLHYKEWIDEESGFPVRPRPFLILLHKDGEDVLGREEVLKIFEAIDIFEAIPGYDDICSQNHYIDETGNNACKVFAMTRFWDHDIDQFNQTIQTDEEAILAMSSDTFPSGTPAYTDFVLGNAERETSEENSTLTFAQSYIVRFDIPDVEGVEDFETVALEEMAKVRAGWENSGPLRMEVFTLFSYDLEFTRAINKDIPLVPLVFFMMAGFTFFVFLDTKDRIKSRGLLGIGAVVCISFSLMTAYGFMFLLGVSFTSMTQILPFIIFGIGLDDTFITTGAYFRTDPSKSIEERIRATMEEVSQSIAMTTITTTFAFLLGCISSVPAIRWLCLYASLSVTLVFAYQITFFISLLVLDERRIQAKHKDICFWIGTSTVEYDDDEDDKNEITRNERNPGDEEETKLFMDHFMRAYASFLMKPIVRILVLLLFLLFFAFCAYRTTLMTQEFKAEDFVPTDSYVRSFMQSLDSYSTQVTNIEVHFRNVNQSDPEMQQQMRDYIADLMELPAINGTDPPFCWVTDFVRFEDDPDFEFMKSLSFNQVIDLALANPAIAEYYSDDFVRDEEGNVISSRCWLNPQYLDLKIVMDQVDLLQGQRAVSASQPINEGVDDFNFFTYNNLYFIWEFYAIAVEELIFTTISGVIAVCVVAFVMIPHFTSCFFTLPMIIILYIDMLGTLQFSGLHINVVTYVCLVISIGLLVDFIMHMLLRFYESPRATRVEKVKDTLETMGASIFVGGFSTFLGVIPLAFSTSKILGEVNTAFAAMVLLGVSHGLILLPVILSFIGPTTCIRHAAVQKMESTDSDDSGDSDDTSSPEGASSDDSDDPSMLSDLVPLDGPHHFSLPAKNMCGLSSPIVCSELAEFGDAEAMELIVRAIEPSNPTSVDPDGLTPQGRGPGNLILEHSISEDVEPQETEKSVAKPLSIDTDHETQNIEPDDVETKDIEANIEANEDIADNQATNENGVGKPDDVISEVAENAVALPKQKLSAEVDSTAVGNAEALRSVASETADKVFGLFDFQCCNYAPGKSNMDLATALGLYKPKRTLPDVEEFVDDEDSLVSFDEKSGLPEF